MILDTESSSLAHVLHIVRQVAHQAFLPQLRRNRRLQGYDITTLLCGHKARASSRDYLDLIRGKLDLLTVDGKAEHACLVQQFCRCVYTLVIERLELRQDFLYQRPVFGAEYLYLRLQSVCEHIAIVADQFHAFDIQFFEYLVAQAAQRLFLIPARYTYIQGVQRLTYLDMHFFTR